MTGREDVGIKSAAFINLLAGIWLFVSPWVYRVYTHPNAWNGWVFGFLIFLFSLIRISSPQGTRGFSVVNLTLGAWVFISPWIYGYTADTGRLVNSLCVGSIVFVVGVIGSSLHHESTTMPPPLHS